MRDAADEFKNDNYKKAIELYLSIIRNFPKHYYAHLWAGTAYSANEEPEKARECYKKAIRLNSKGYDAYYNYSRLEMKENRYQNSLELLNKALLYYPVKSKDFGELYYQKGLLEYYLYNYQDALESFNKSLEYKPDDINAQNGKVIAAEGILFNNNIPANNN